jgi:SAM-dependent methyltransferase
VKVTAKRSHAARWLQGSGIEIGALHNPLAVPPAATVHYVDRFNAEDLKRHYPELGDQSLVPVDLIGDAEDLSRFGDGSQDFVIANHLLEHLENPIRGLQEMARVLRPGGILYVALPDPRLTFDRARDLTPIDHVAGEYRTGTDATREVHYAEWVERAEPLVEWMIDAGVPTGPDRVRELMGMDYSIHFHVWRPEGFLEVIAAARAEAGVALELLEFAASRPGEDDEYIFIFGKGIDDLPPLPPGDQAGRTARDPSADGGRRDPGLADPGSLLEELQARLQSQSAVVDEYRELQASAAFRVAVMCRAAVRRAAPAGTRRRRLTAALAREVTKLAERGLDGTIRSVRERLTNAAHDPRPGGRGSAPPRSDRSE